MTSSTFKAQELPGRLPGVTVPEELHKDDRVSPCLLEEFNDFVGGRTEIEVSRYTSRTFYDREMEGMWSRTWQWVCRVEQLSAVGDAVVYEIGRKSVVVVRSEPGVIKAYYNACPHRGRRLVDCNGHMGNIRCPFHGFTFGLDGALKRIPESWDFPHVEPDEFSLSEVRVSVYAGFVFINMDPQAPSLEEYLGDLPDHLSAWNFDDRFVAAHFGKVMKANWKVALEAFLENMHAFATHPQALKCLADSNMQYDAARDRGHWSRMIGLYGVPSPHLKVVDEQNVLDAMDVFLLDHFDLPEGQTARHYAAEVVRERLNQATGVDFTGIADGEMLDLIAYHIFPNVVLFGGYGSPVAFRFLPWGDDHEECIWEFMFLMPRKPGDPVPPAAPRQLVGIDQNWMDVETLHPNTRNFLQQDLNNIEPTQAGMHSLQRKTLTISNYIESLIRAFHERLDSYLASTD
jgi:phenylpropionate dioxygenase-like ring-hydroxylating dioxygenase large terminal subunit